MSPNFKCYPDTHTHTHTRGKSDFLRVLKFLGLSLFLPLLIYLLGVGIAMATLTLDSISLTSDGALTLKSASSSVTVIGETNQRGAITMASSSEALTLNLGTGAGTTTVNIATGAAANIITIGSTSASSVIVSSLNTYFTGGNVGIGLTSPTSALHVSGTFAATATSTFSGNLTFGTTISGSCAGLTGYVWVPGSAKFGTLPGFCVMKYEAKNDGSNNAVSTAAGAPYVSISQRTAEDKALAACAGCHLITEAEWMTIANDVLWVNANWCDLTGTNCNNAPGTASRYLAAGHNDNSPAAALAASADDSQACYGTVTADTNTACGGAGTQKRTLTLSNGNVLWDIAGNVYDWTDAWILGADQPTVSGSDNSSTSNFNWREYTAINKRWGALSYANPTDRAWNSSQRIGQIYSTDNTATTDSNYTQYAFLRGGSWGTGSDAGAFALPLNYTPADTGTYVGFRVAR